MRHYQEWFSPKAKQSKQKTHVHSTCEVGRLDRDRKPMAVELKHI